MKALTIRKLIADYRSDAVSPYQKLRYRTKENYDSLLRRLDTDHGSVALADIRYRSLREWHGAWSAGGKISIAHSLVGMLRTLFSFGLTILEDKECERLSIVLHKSKFEMGKPRTERLTAAQAEAIRTTARTMNLASIARAQAFQFEGMLRQKDVIGEWVPESEPGDSYVTWRGMKWLRGIRWEEIDADLILEHVTSKRQKSVTIDLKLAPMVLIELQSAYCDLGDILTRDRLPATGPIILDEEHGVPYHNYTFRRTWRAVATAAGVPKAVKNMDSRAGAITEATEAGADLEHIKHAATHSDIGMTQRYARGGAEKTAKVQQQRVAHRGAIVPRAVPATTDEALDSGRFYFSDDAER